MFWISRFFKISGIPGLSGFSRFSGFGIFGMWYRASQTILYFDALWLYLDRAQKQANKLNRSKSAIFAHPSAYLPADLLAYPANIPASYLRTNMPTPFQAFAAKYMYVRMCLFMMCGYMHAYIHTYICMCVSEIYCGWLAPPTRRDPPRSLLA